MPRRLLLALLVLAVSCASTPPATTQVVVLMPPQATGVASRPEVLRQVGEAVTRAVAWTSGFQVKSAAVAKPGEALGVTEVELDASGLFVTVRFQILGEKDAAVAGFATTVPLDHPETWAWTFQKKLGSATRPDEPGPALGALLSSPRGSARDEALLQVRFLDLVRSEAWRSDGARLSEVAPAFRARFLRELSVALDRPQMVLVKGGTFSLGSDQGERDEAPSQRVRVGDFLMARTEVTQAEYEAVTGFQPSLFTQPSDAPRRPVERVTWYDAVEFCNALSLKEGLAPVYTLTKRTPASGWPITAAEVTQDRSRSGYRLPTEAEWEWAARGGVVAQGFLLAGGDDPRWLAWADGTDAGPAPVAEKRPNELGLYDLSGNVWEWCWDWYGFYEASGDDPEGPSLGVMRVGRGGSWKAAAWNSRVTARSFDSPGSRGSNLGFRVVRTLPPISQAAIGGTSAPAPK